MYSILCCIMLDQNVINHVLFARRNTGKFIYKGLVLALRNVFVKGNILMHHVFKFGFCVKTVSTFNK